MDDEFTSSPTWPSPPPLSPPPLCIVIPSSPPLSPSPPPSLSPSPFVRSQRLSQLSPPPTDGLFETHEEAFSLAQSHAKDEGYALVYHKPSNYANGRPRRYDIVCACGGRPYRSKSSGLREGATRKTNCLFKLKIVQRKINGDCWSIEIMCGDHNHDADDPSAFPEHRILPPNQIEQVHRQSLQLGMTARAIQLSLKASDSRACPTAQDIYNLQRKRRQEVYGDLTATQAMLKKLDDLGVPHEEEFDDQNRLLRHFLIIDVDFGMWKSFHHVPMFDTTYNTNRYGMKLCQMNGITSLGTIFPLAYALTHSEDADFYIWALENLGAWLRSFSEAEERPEDEYYPLVVITDFDAAGKVGIDSIFPHAQQQLCIWHIQKNVQKMIKERWIGRGGIPQADAAMLVTFDDPPPAGAPPADSLTQDHFFAAFNEIQRAATPEDCEARWIGLQRDFYQQKFLPYLRDTYMPLRAQWARAYTGHYRNYGHNTGSPYEALHASAKSLLRNAPQSLYELFNALLTQYNVIFDDFKVQKVTEARRIRNEFRHDLLFGVTEKVSWKALSLVNKQYLLAKGGLLCSPDHRQSVCSGGFMKQFGLPCRHVIRDEFLRVEGIGKAREVITSRPLDLSYFDHQWIIREPLDELDPYRQIRDPRIVPRRRRPQNAALPVPPRPPPQPLPRSLGKRKKPTVQVDALSQAIRSIVREEIERARPRGGAFPVEERYEVEEAAATQRNERPRTIRRSESAQKEMERIPSGFESRDFPQNSQKTPYRGPKEYPRSFRVLASQPLSIQVIRTVENEGLGAFPSLSKLQQNTVQNERQEGRQLKRQRQSHSARQGRLLPYEHCIDLT